MHLIEFLLKNQQNTSQKMTEHELEKDLADSLKKDQLEGVDVRVRVPRAIWVEMLRSMKSYHIAQASDYIANLVRHDAEMRNDRGQRLPPSGGSGVGSTDEPAARRAIRKFAHVFRFALADTGAVFETLATDYAAIYCLGITGVALALDVVTPPVAKFILLGQH